MSLPDVPRFPTEAATPGRFERGPYPFTDRITADGASGYPAEPGRYHLYVSWACPWAHRTAIVRELLGLHEVVTMSAVDPIRDERGWRFDAQADPAVDGHGPDPVNGFAFLDDAYRATDPDYPGRPTVPVVWDRQHRRIVTNEFRTIDRQLATAFDAHAHADVELYPPAVRAEIDALDEAAYPTLNDGVYRAGFARTQQAHDEAVEAVFAMLDWLEERMSTRRFAVADELTLADVRLYVTLARFDAVYHYHFKCNLRRLSDYPNLWRYTRSLYHLPAFGQTTRFDHIKAHYYRTHPHLNPSGIVPRGPLVDWGLP